MKKTRQLVSIAVALTGLAVAFPSHADRKVYPGTFCQDINNTMNGSNVYYGETHYMQNNATGNNTVGCPVVRDNHDKGVADWDVTVDRQGASGTWELTLFSTDTDGNSFHSDTISVPASPSSGTVSLDGDAVTSFQDFGMVYITSVMPPGARIHRFYVQEDT